MANTLVSKIASASIKVGALKPDKTNTHQSYDYISADKVLDRAGAALAEAGVVIYPSVTHEETTRVDYTDNYGKAKSRYDSVVHFGMIVTDGETQLELPWRGRGNDSAVPDKAYFKAVTSGHKYFVMKLLNIGIGNEDGEHEVTEPAVDATGAAQRALTPVKVQTSTQPPKQAQTPASKPRATVDQVQQLDTLGVEFYGEEWPEQRTKLAAAVSKGAVQQPTDLLASEISKLIEGVAAKMSEVNVKTAAPVPH